MTVRRNTVHIRRFVIQFSSGDTVFPSFKAKKESHEKSMAKSLETDGTVLWGNFSRFLLE